MKDGRDRTGGDKASSSTDPQREAPTPGKQTLVQSQKSPVTRGGAAKSQPAPAAGPSGPPLRWRDLASAKRMTPPRELPFRKELEASFGVDLGFVRARVGGEAAAAAAEQGSRAFAHGDDVVLPEDADIHVVAHEVAHVLQQRGGNVQLYGGEGRAGDRHEQEANAAADAVVSGKPASSAMTVSDRGAQPAGVQRDDGGAPLELADRVKLAKEFIDKKAISISGHLGLDEGPEPAMQKPPFMTLNVKSFMARVFSSLFEVPAQMWPTLVRLFGQQAVVDMVERGRDDTVEFYPHHGKVLVSDWEQFAGDLRSRFVPLLADSLNRVGPRYAFLRTALAMPIYRLTNEWPFGDAVPQVEASKLIPSHPLDRHVIATLCEPNHAWVHYAQVHAAYPDVEMLASVTTMGPRPVKFLFEYAEGLHNWITVTEPADPTPEEVSQELYDTTENAHQLIRAGRRFGFPSPYRVALKQGLQAAWMAKEDKRKTERDPDDRNPADLRGGDARGTDVGILNVQDGDRDPAREMVSDPALAEIAIREQSATVTVKEAGKPLGILQRYSLIVTDLGLVSAGLDQLPHTANIGSLLKRTQARAKKIQDGDTELAKTYDVSSNIQQQVMSAARTSIQALLPSWTKLRDAVQGDASAGLARTYMTVANLFADAVAASELPETALERLAVAQRAAKELPLELLESMLSNARNMIMSGRAVRSDPDGAYQLKSYDYGLDNMELVEAAVRQRLRDAREYIVSDPSKLTQIINESQELIEELQSNATILLAVQSTNALMHELEVHQAGWFDPTRKGPALAKKEVKVQRWNLKWSRVNRKFLDYKYARTPEEKIAAKQILDQAFHDIQGDTEWQGLHADIARTIKHEEKLAKWVKIGLMIGIAVATMGVGSYATGIAEGLKLGTLANIGFVAGAEAVTATTLGQLLVDHPTLKGYFSELGMNYATFFVFRGLSTDWHAAYGNGVKATVFEMVFFQLVQTAHAVHKAAAAHREATGRDLTAGEVFDIVTENLVVAGATALIGFAAHRKLDAIRNAGKDFAKPRLIASADRIEAIDAATVRIAEEVLNSKNPQELYRALENEKLALDARRRLFEELLEKDGQAAREAGLDPEKIRTQQDEISARLGDNRASLDILKLEPTAPGEFLYPADELQGFFERQNPSKKPELLEPDQYTNARRYRVTPTTGEPFIVTEKLPGMGRVFGGLDRSKARPGAGVPDFADHPVFAASSVANVAGLTSIRVGHALPDAGTGHTVLRGLAEGDPAAFERIGLDPPAKGFDPRAIEWGLGRRGKEYIIIRGRGGFVDWGDFPGVEALAHSHPFRAGKTIQGGDGPDGAVPFDSVKLENVRAGDKVSLRNQVNVYPSAADVVFAGVRGIDGHVVHTPYRIKIGPNGERLLTNPTPDGAGRPLSFRLGKPEHVGYWTGDKDIPVYRVQMEAEAAGYNETVYAADHPGVGSLLSHSVPDRMQPVSLGEAAPSSGPVTKAGEFVPTNEVERRAAAAWTAIKESPANYKGPRIQSFETDFLPMYREGWMFDVEAGQWRRPGTRVHAEPLPENITPESATAQIRHGDRFIDVLIDEKLVTKAEVEAEVANQKPGGHYEDVVRANVKRVFQPRVVKSIMELTPEQLGAPPGSDHTAIAAARRERFAALTRHFGAADREALAAEFYRQNFMGGDEGGKTILKAANPGVGMTGDRELAGVSTKRVGADTDYVEVNTAVKVIASDDVLTPKQMQEARDLRRMIGEDVKTAGADLRVDKLRYVFMSAEGAKKNIAFIEAMLESRGGEAAVQIEIFDPQGRRQLIEARDALDQPSMKWLGDERSRRGFDRAQQRVGEELHGKELADAAAHADSNAPYDPAHRVSVDARTGYDLAQPSDRQKLVSDVVTRAKERAATQPKGRRQGVFVDLRGADLDAEAVARMRERIVDLSDGTITHDDLVFLEGSVPSEPAANPKKPDDPRSAAEAQTDPREMKRYQKPKYRNRYSTFEAWWEAVGKKWHPNKHGKPGKPDDHVPTVERLKARAEADFPGHIVHDKGSIIGMKTASGRKIRSVDREPDVWVESATERGTVLKVYEAARTNQDGSFVPREMAKKRQYDGLGLPSHFEPVMSDEAYAAAAAAKDDD